MWLQYKVDTTKIDNIDKYKINAFWLNWISIFSFAFYYIFPDIHLQYIEAKSGYLIIINSNKDYKNWE